MWSPRILAFARAGWAICNLLPVSLLRSKLLCPSNLPIDRRCNVTRFTKATEYTPVKRLVQGVLTYLLCGVCTTVHAQNRFYDDSRVRIDLGLSNGALAVDDGFDRVTQSTLLVGGTFTYQHGSGFYGRVGLGRADDYNLELEGGNAVDPDQQYLTTSLGLGYRVSRQTGDGLFWGLGFSSRSTDLDDDDASNTAFAFWEKDNARRYGIVEAGFNSQGDLSAIVVEGKHLWFGQGGIGIGLTWLLGSGRLDAPPGVQDLDVAAARFGVVAMFRPVL